MFGVIYKITNLLNGKIYIGQTVNFQHRVLHHKSSNRTGVDAAIKKYGWENFKIEVIEECPIDQLDKREIFWIAKLDCVAPKGYNLTFGGNAKRIVSEVTRKKLSANSKKFVGKNNPFFGKHHTAEAKAKNAAAHMGRKASVLTRVKMSVSHKKIFYPNLEEVIDKKSLTRKELAEKIDVNYHTLKRKLRGEITLDLKTAEKIRNFLGVEMSIEELFARN